MLKICIRLWYNPHSQKLALSRPRRRHGQVQSMSKLLARNLEGMSTRTPTHFCLYANYVIMCRCRASTSCWCTALRARLNKLIRISAFHACLCVIVRKCRGFASCWRTALGASLKASPHCVFAIPACCVSRCRACTSCWCAAFGAGPNTLLHVSAMPIV